MKPFMLAPGWRIVSSEHEFTLEYLQAPRRGSRAAKPSWRARGHFGRFEHALKASESEMLRQSPKSLPEALVEVRDLYAQVQAERESIEQRRDAEAQGDASGDLLPVLRRQ
jgi:hypothetical protein